MKGFFLAALLFLGWAPGARAAEWNLEAFNKAVAASGRSMKLSQNQFDGLQQRKIKMLANIEAYLTLRLKKADPEVLRVFKELPREYFHYQYERQVSLARSAYESDAKPYAIGYGSALSDYLGQAYMTQLLQVKPGQTVLEIGTGSGYQISALSRLAGQVYSIEIQKPLGEAVAKIFPPLGYDNIHSRVGDGFYGWPEVKGGFDRVIVTCAASYVPPALTAQLKPGGIMVIPVGPPFKRSQVLYVYHKDAAGKLHSRRTASVYFVPMTGDISKSAAN
jgi:protein-L-isoaspartate(D-aspartate) O-methyltransferase